MEKVLEKKKPKYNSWQNTKYMVGRAWKDCKSVLVIVALIALSSVALTTVQLLTAPLILRQLELHESLSALVRVTMLFTVLLVTLSAIRRYFNSNLLFPRVEVRTGICDDIGIKRGATSYANLFDEEYRNVLQKACSAVNSNSEATDAVWCTLTDILKNALGFIIYLYIISNMNVAVILLVLVTTVTGFFINKMIGDWDYIHKEEKSENQRKTYYLNGVLRSRYYAKDIRIFGLGDWLCDVRMSTNRLVRSFYTKRERTYFLTNLVDMALTLLRNGAAYAYLIYQVLENGMSASEFLLYFGAVGGFTSWITGILDQLLILHRQSNDISVVREFLEWHEPYRFEGGKEIKTPEDGLYEIELKNVSYRYPEAEADTITDMNLTLHAGEKLAIVGLNGAGKTTLVKLITGLLDPTEGRVLLNGTDIREFNRTDYYKLFSSVFQDFSVLDASLKENVAQRVTGIDEEKVNKCLELAGLTDKLKELPDGLDTKIGREVFENGVELSGGQTQRLMLARALYKGGSILALDEPTAALDPIAENDIYLKYNEMTAGKTSLFISHRLASTRFCDRIILLKDGKIAEEGTHESLMNKEGEYAELFEVQSRYYKEGGETEYEEAV